MRVEPLLRSWIVEAVSAAGRSASSLTVARHVWRHHESELHAAGDLLLTWQVDLQATAQAMVDEGSLEREGTDRWRLPEGAVAPAPPPGSGPWRADEISAVVTGYLTMLRADRSGQPLRRSQVLADLVAATGRSNDRIEALLANVSAVVQEHGIEPLTSFRPRSNVPAGVRPVVAAALAEQGSAAATAE